MIVRSILNQTFTELNKSYDNLSAKFTKQYDYELYNIQV